METKLNQTIAEEDSLNINALKAATDMPPLTWFNDSGLTVMLFSPVSFFV